MTDRVTVHVHEGVADVRLNRPDKLNALDIATFEALAETGDALAADPSVRAVVLSGEGRAFCAGLDFANFAEDAIEDVIWGVRDILDLFTGGDSSQADIVKYISGARGSMENFLQ